MANKKGGPKESKTKATSKLRSASPSSRYGLSETDLDQMGESTDSSGPRSATSSPAESEKGSEGTIVSADLDSSPIGEDHLKLERALKSAASITQLRKPGAAGTPASAEPAASSSVQKSTIELSELKVLLAELTQDIKKSEKANEKATAKALERLKQDLKQEMERLRQEVQLERQVLGKIEERIQENSVKLSTLTDQLEDLKETFTYRIEMAEKAAASAEEKAVNVSSECKKLGDRLAALEDGSRRYNVRIEGLENSIKAYHAEKGNSILRYKDTRKVHILIPLDCHIPDEISKEDDNIHFLDNLPDTQLNVAGVMKRSYKHSVYEIFDESKRPHYCIVEYATPLASLYEMSKDSQAAFSSQDRLEQTKLFYRTLKDILEDSKECGNLYRLVLLNGSDRTSTITPPSQGTNSNTTPISGKKIGDSVVSESNATINGEKESITLISMKSLITETVDALLPSSRVMGSAAKEGGFRELMKRVLHQFLTAKKEKLIESPFERDCEQHQTTAFFESELLNFPFPGNCMLLEEAMDAVQSQLAGQIELCLSSSKKSQLHCQELLIPKHLCQRIARDIMYMSANEPCGLRGAVIYVNLEVDGLCKTLGRIQQDSSVPPTFELTFKDAPYPEIREQAVAMHTKPRHHGVPSSPDNPLNRIACE
ncbi:STING protein, partial [Polypterus senegalus]